MKRKVNYRRKLVVILAVIILTGTLFYIEHPSVQALKNIAASVGIIDSQHTIIGITDIQSVDHVRGDTDSDVILIEYSDLSCVMCAAMQDNFEKIVREENIMLVSRHLYPYTKGFVFEQAVTAECVAKHAGEAAFFTFIRYIYENQHIIDKNAEELTKKAEELGVNAQKLQGCVTDDTKVRKRIQKDSKEGWRLGARGTPYIVVVYKNKPVGISYANEYAKFLERVKMLIAETRS